MKKVTRLIPLLIFLSIWYEGNTQSSCSCGEKDSNDNYKGYQMSAIQNAVCHLLAFEFQTALAKSKGKYTEDFPAKRKNFPLGTSLLNAYHYLSGPEPDSVRAELFLGQAERLLKGYGQGDYSSENEYVFLKQYLPQCLPSVIQKMKALLPAKKNDATERQSELEKRIAELEEKTGGLKGQIETLKNDKETLQSELDSLRVLANQNDGGASEALQRKIDALTQELVKKQQIIAQLTEQLNAEREKVTHLSARDEVLLSENISSQWPEQSHDSSSSFAESTVKLEVDTFFFAFDSYVLSEKDLSRLDELAERILSCRGACEISVYAYADNQGDEKDNYFLAGCRMDQVLNRLKEKGVDTAKIHGKNFGETGQSASSVSRRVEIHINWIIRA